VEKQETAPIPPVVEDSGQSEQPEQASSFSPPEDLTKMETFSGTEAKNETKKPRRKHSEHSDK
jgi:hypothetical protein